jgi:hypothetical protein
MLAEANTLCAFCKTNLPVNTFTASFGGTVKLYANSVFEDTLFKVKLTLAEEEVMFVTCAIKIIEVDVIGAVYSVVFEVVKVPVTFRKVFRLAITELLQ